MTVLKDRISPLYLDPADLGRSLEEVASEVIETKAHNVISRWFRGVQDIDVFLWTDDGHNIIKQRVNYLGQIVEWNVVEGLRTGMVVEFENENEEDEEKVLYDLEPQTVAVEQSLEVIRHMKALNDIERQVVLNNFKGFHFTTLQSPLYHLKLWWLRCWILLRRALRFFSTK